MRAQRTRRRTWRSRFRIFGIYVQIAILAGMAILLGVIGGTFYSVSKMLPNGLDITGYDPTEASKIISYDGVVLAGIFEENREVVPITEVPKHLQTATIAIEDERFYSHFGVDFRGIARAMFANVRKGHMAQGGSTLTQQLARNIYLTHEKKLSRKLQEIVLAIELERNYTKEQILELYLNQVYYGSGAYGVQTASRIYFDKDVKDLTLAECALLAGLPQKPSSYSPYEDKSSAVARRNTVLSRMAALNYITREQSEKAKAEKVKLVGQKPVGLGKYKAPWFVTYVIKQLTDKYGADLVYRGGLRVYTTLNYEMQQVAEKELRQGVANAKSRNVSQGALICIDPQTGHIKAMVGSVNPDFTKDQFNRAVQAKRQPGSAFKAFVYTAAVDSGYDPNFQLSNERKTHKGYGSKDWTPRNYDGSHGGKRSMRDAVAKSINLCAISMTELVGIDQVITYARMLGIKSPLDRNLSLALGASVVTPIEICSAYGVFAAKGYRAEPMCIVRITESDGLQEGAVIEDNRPVIRQVLSEQTAETMSELFRGVVTYGTGYAARRISHSHGKTGTTSSDRDAWFLGYTPELVTAVWVGNDDYKPMRSVWGGNVCAPIWTAFMLEALKIHKKEHEKEALTSNRTEKETNTAKDKPVRKPGSDEHSADSERRAVKLCSESGLLATSACPRAYEARPDVGTEPVTTCPLHRSGLPGEDSPEELTHPSGTAATTSPARPGTAITKPSGEYVTVTICADSGQLGSIYCPETVQRTFRSSEVPTKKCQLHKPPVN